MHLNLRHRVLASTILAISLACAAEAAIPTSERAALIALYSSTDGANWSNNSGWLGPQGTECEWYGVTCDSSDGHVQRLYLPSNNLTGEIPSAIGDLYLIQRLRLQGNHLTGAIPSQFSNFWVVEEIDLSNNELTGSIPLKPGDKAGYHLQDLNLANNQLTGTIPASLGDLKAMKYLELSNNQLTGAIPSDLKDLYPLRRLELSRNQLSGAIPAQLFTNLPFLTDLNLQDNRFTGAIPRQISNLPSLEYLYLQGNKLMGPIPAQLADLATLRNGSGLDLRWNAVYTSDVGLAAFLNTKQVGGDWQGTQTVKPTGVSASTPTHNSVTLDWTPIAYTADGGFYQVFVSGVSGGPYSAFGTVTDSKASTSLAVTGLDSETTYFFVVKTTTEAHANNLNELVSEASEEVLATTAAPPVYADIGVGVIESVDPVLAGDEVSYTITAENHGPSGATSLELGIELTLPDHVAVNSVLPGKGTVSGAAPSYTWAIGGLVNGESSDLDLVLAVKSGASGGTDLISVEVLVASLTEVDPQSENDQDSESTSVAAVIPATERAALLALYNSTAGPSWTTKTNWGGAVGTECTWFGVTCNGEGTAVTQLNLSNNNLAGSINSELGDLGALTELNLSVNQLTGPIPSSLGNLSSLEILTLDNNHLTLIPPELGSLAALEWLDLSQNELSGEIPSEIANLSLLTRLWLYSNQLSGELPPELGSLSLLQWLLLADNFLGGTIPDEIGSLTSLQVLDLASNQFSGGIPTTLTNLADLHILGLESNRLSGRIPDGIINLSILYSGQTDLRWNGLYTDDAPVVDFLNEKQEGGDWQSTQTLAPKDLSVDSVGDHTAWLGWSSVSYTDPGGYEVFYSPSGLDQWASGGWTDSKSDTAFPVTGLDPSVEYDFVVTSFTLPHADNLNDVNSDPGVIESAVTSETGCAEPNVDVHYGSPTTLTLNSIHDSVVWSTGETTMSIVVDPPSSRWFWVSTTGPGGCAEAATIFVNISTVFADGFETRDCDWWSRSVGLSE